MRHLSYGRQSIDDSDIQAVVDVLRSDFLTKGPAIDRFENDFCQATGARYAVACANGTAALHLAALAAGLQPGDRVLTTPLTFVASANCARYLGAEMAFADVTLPFGLLDPQACKAHLEAAAAAGRPFRALITVDLGGHPCDMPAFAALKEAFGFTWIHDACHSLGATWSDGTGTIRSPGAFPAVDLTAFSFHPVKHITTGEGGMVTTHREDLARHLRLLRTHGITKDPAQFRHHDLAFDEDGTPNPWYYEMQELGYNYRLTDLQAALGSAQLKRLSAFLASRRTIAARYRTGLQGLPHITVAEPGPGVEHAYHLASVLIDFPALGHSRAWMMKRLAALNIGTQVHYIPVPVMPAYGTGAALEALPNTRWYYQRTLSLPCFHGLTEHEIDYIIENLLTILKNR